MEIAVFINEWGAALKNITIIVGTLVAVYNLIGKLKDIEKSIKEIPEFRNTIAKIQTDVTYIQETTDKMQSNQKDNEEVTKKLIEDLSAHCNNGILKEKLTLAIARQTLLNEIETSTKLGWVSVDRRAVISELYEMYRKNKGNGTIQKLWESYMDLPIKL